MGLRGPRRAVRGLEAARVRPSGGVCSAGQGSLCARLPPGCAAAHVGSRGIGFLNELVLDGLMVVVALFLVTLNGLFVAAEFAFVKLRATQVERFVREGRATA